MMPMAASQGARRGATQRKGGLLIFLDPLLKEVGILNAKICSYLLYGIYVLYDYMT